MKLRNHPLMVYRTMPNWPPIWIEKYAENTTLSGEIGVLSHVGVSSGRRPRCFLHITHNNKPYVGSLIFDDPAFSAYVTALLKKNINKTIREIGDLDVSHSF
jgi:hypothetical protein